MMVLVSTRVWSKVCGTALGLSLLGAAGCQRDGSGLSEEAFCQEYARIECEKVAGFCSFSAAACEPSRAQACRDMGNRLKGGMRQYNAANTGACLKKLEDAYKTLPITAATLAGLEEACARVFAGTAKSNDPCAANYDCAGTLVCDKGFCGVEKVVASRAGCANVGERCPRGEYCTNTSTTGLFLCIPRTPLDSPCAISTPCMEDLRCRTTCVRRLDTGAPCLEDDDCLSGYCNRYVSNRTCGVGLTFSAESPSCFAYLGGPDGGTPSRTGNEIVDSGTD
jgi:hypothetical protein